MPSARDAPDVPSADAVRVPAAEVPPSLEFPDADSVPDDDPVDVDGDDASPPDCELEESPSPDELERVPGTLGEPLEVPLGSGDEPEVEPPLVPEGDPPDDPLGSADGQPPEVPSVPAVGKDEPPDPVEPPLDPVEPPLDPEDPPLDPDDPPLEPDDPPELPLLPPDGEDCPPLVAQPAINIAAKARTRIPYFITGSLRSLRGGEVIALQERAQLIRHPIAGCSLHTRDEREGHDRPDQG